MTSPPWPIHRRPRPKYGIAWLTGLCEGEAWFGWSDRPCIEVEMTDRDVIEIVAELFDRKVQARPARSHKWKPTFRVCIRGKDAVGWMLTMYAGLRTRRRAQIRGVLTRWRNG